MRPSFDEIYMELAQSVARRSTCKRLSVGCVIVSPDYRKVISLGYNGNATGFPNECDSDTPGACGDLHAEENAIINCDVPRDTPKVVYVTHNPCMLCAKRFINLGGVKAIYFRQYYRDSSPIALLRRAEIKCESIAEKWLDDVVDKWHDNHYEGLGLHEVLEDLYGLTKEECERWSASGDLPSDFVTRITRPA